MNDIDIKIEQCKIDIKRLNDTLKDLEQKRNAPVKPKHGDIALYHGEKRIIIKGETGFYSYDAYGCVIHEGDLTWTVEKAYNSKSRTERYEVIGNIFDK